MHNWLRFTKVTDALCLMTYCVWKAVRQMNMTLHPDQSSSRRGGGGPAGGKAGFLKATSWTCSSTLPRQKSLQTFTRSWGKCECCNRQGSHQENRVLVISAVWCSEGILMSFYFSLFQQNGEIFPETGRGLGDLCCTCKEENRWVWGLSASAEEVAVQSASCLCMNIVGKGHHNRMIGTCL